MCFLLLFFPHVLIFVTFVQVSKAKAVVDRIPDLAESQPELRPDPQRSLFRYMFSKPGGYVRNSWPLPEASSNRVKFLEKSPSGCTKKRRITKGTGDRCMLMFWHCMRHNTCVGWHSMPFGEGRRDVVAVLFALKEKPPQYVFYDFACNASVVSMNTLPEYFAKCKFFHDLFHFTAHRCSTSGCSARFLHLAKLRTTVMEQV